MILKCQQCSRRVLFFRRVGGLCVKCLDAENLAYWNEKKQEAEIQEREIRLNDIPYQLLNSNLRKFVEFLTGDSSVITATVVLWPEEISTSESIGGEVFTRLATGGFVGRIRSQPFGVVAISNDNVWRIEVGNLSSSYEFYDVERIMKEKLARFATQDLNAEVDYSVNATALTLRNKQTSHIVAIFVFPNTFELPFNHPFFEYASENPSGKAFEIGKKIGLITARQEQ